MRQFNWLLLAFLAAIGGLVGAAIYFLPTVDDANPLIILIGIGSMLIVNGIQDLFS